MKLSDSRSGLDNGAMNWKTSYFYFMYSKRYLKYNIVYYIILYYIIILLYYIILYYIILYYIILYYIILYYIILYSRIYYSIIVAVPTEILLQSLCHKWWLRWVQHLGFNVWSRCVKTVVLCRLCFRKARHLLLIKKDSQHPKHQ